MRGPCIMKGPIPCCAQIACMRAVGQETDGFEQDGYRGFGLSFHLVKVPFGGRCVVCGSSVS